MSELYVVGDIGATNRRVAVYEPDGRLVGRSDQTTLVGNYERTIDSIAASARKIAGSRVGSIVAASIAAPVELNAAGIAISTGSMQSWLSRRPVGDIAIALGLPEERTGVMNDTEAIGVSQHAVNLRSGWRINGYATTLSSGWGGSRYREDGKVENDEPGHYFLREGAQCPCGRDGCAEAHVSGNGVKINHGREMAKWLEEEPTAADQLVTDLSTAVIQLIERQRTEEGFDPEEIRWTGSVAINQPFLVTNRVAENVRDGLRMAGSHCPAFDMVTLGHEAGLHGTFIDARNRAAA